MPFANFADQFSSALTPLGEARVAKLGAERKFSAERDIENRKRKLAQEADRTSYESLKAEFPYLSAYQPGQDTPTKIRLETDRFNKQQAAAQEQADFEAAKKAVPQGERVPTPLINAGERMPVTPEQIAGGAMMLANPAQIGYYQGLTQMMFPEPVEPNVIPPALLGRFTTESLMGLPQFRGSGIENLVPIPDEPKIPPPRRPVDIYNDINARVAAIRDLEKGSPRGSGDNKSMTVDPLAITTIRDIQRLRQQVSSLQDELIDSNARANRRKGNAGGEPQGTPTGEMFEGKPVYQDAQERKFVKE